MLKRFLPKKGKEEADSQPTQGFVCPVCMRSFSSPTSLQLHFEHEHSDPPFPGASSASDEKYVCSSCNAVCADAKELQNHHEMHYQGTLDNRDGGILALMKDGLDGKTSHVEVGLLTEQLQATEESRILLSSEVNFLRQQLKVSEEKCHAVEKKAGAQASQFAEQKARVDELESQRVILADSVATLEDEVRQKSARIKYLEKATEQRQVNDDVEVLQHELIRLHALVDELTAASDTKSSLENYVNSNHGTECVFKTEEDVSRLQLQRELNEKNQMMSELRQVLDTKNSFVQQKESHNRELEMQVQASSKQNAKLYQTIAALEEQIKNLQEQHGHNWHRISEHDALVAEKDVSLKEMEESLNGRTAAYNDVLARLQLANDTVVGVEGSLLAEKEKAKQLEGKLSAVEQSLRDRTLECENAESRLRAATRQLAKVESDLLEEQEKLKVSEKSYDERITDYDNIRTELSMTNEELAKTLDELSKEKGRVTELEAKLGEVQSLVTEKDVLLAERETLLTERETLLVEKELAITNHCENIDKLTRALNERTEEAEYQARSLATLNTELCEIKRYSESEIAAKQSLQSDIELLTVQHNEKEAMVHKMQVQLLETERKLSQEQRQQTACKERIDEMDKRLADNRDIINRLEIERSQLINQIEVGDAVKTVIEQLNAEKVEQDALRSRLESESEGRQVHIRELRERIEELVNETKLKENGRLVLEQENKSVLERLQKSKDDHSNEISEHAKTVARLEISETALLKISSHLQTYQKEVESAHEELAQSKYTIGTLENEISKVKSELTNVNAEQDRIQLKLEHREQELNSTKLEVERLCNDGAVMTERHEALRATLQEEQSRHKLALASAEQDRNTLSSLQEKQQRLAERISVMEGELELKEEALICSKVELNVKEAELSETKVEINRAKAELIDKNVELVMREAEFSKTNAELNQVKTELIDKKVELGCLEEGLGHKEAELHQIKTDLDQAVAELSDKKVEFGRLEEELNQTKRDFDLTKVQLSQSNSEQSQMKAELDRKEAELNQTKAELDKKHVEHSHTQMELNQVKGELNLKEASLIQTRAELNEKEVEIGEKSASVMQLGDVAAMLNKDLDAVRDELQVTALNLLQVTAEKNSVKDLLLAAQFDIEQLKGKLSDSVSQLSNTTSQLQSEIEANQLASQGLIALETELSNVRIQTGKQITELEQKCATYVTAGENVVAELNSSIEKLMNEKSLLSSEIGNAQNDLQALALQKKETEERMTDVLNAEKELHEKERQRCLALQTELTDLQQQHTQQAAKILTLEEEIRAMEARSLQDVQAINITQASLRRELEESRLEVAAARQQMDEAQKLRELQMTAFSENVTTLRDENTALRERMRNLEKAEIDLQGQRLELEAKLLNSNGERTALLERCIAAEREYEGLHERYTELRRHHDNIQAGLHELGRENQTLQIITSKFVGRKWADDVEVSNCMACGRQFSFTLRKHHCRNCGDIFCDSCSTKTASVASSKKPERVCDSCHRDLSRQ